MPSGTVRTPSGSGWSKKRRHDGTDDGTPIGRYATGYCPVVVYVRQTHNGHWPVAFFKRYD